MARRMSTTPRSQAPVEHGSILELFEGDETPTAKARAKDEGPTREELMERLAVISERLDRQDRERDQADFRAAPPPPQDIAAQAPKLNLDGLPDPLTNPQEYAKAIAERTVKFQNDMTAYGQKQSAAAAKSLGDYDQLWEDFQESYPEYAGLDSARMKFATEQVVGRLKKRGVDVNKFMFGRSDRFFQMMTEEYDATFGGPEEQGDYDDTPEERPAPRRQARPADDLDDGDDGRSDGILGAGDIPGAQRRGPQAPQGGLIEDLQAIQRKTGYY